MPSRVKTVEEKLKYDSLIQSSAKGSSRRFEHLPKDSGLHVNTSGDILEIDEEIYDDQGHSKRNFWYIVNPFDVS